MLDLVLKSVKQTQQNSPLCSSSLISHLPLWDPYHLFFVVIARETMMLDLGKDKHKQITFTFASFLLRYWPAAEIPCS